MTAFLSFLKNLFIPNGLFFLVIFFIPSFLSLHQNLWPYAQYYPYIFYIIAAILCLRFHKDRYLFTIIWIGVSERTLYYLISGNAGLVPTSGLLHSCIGILLPVNLVLFELIKDRGVLTLRGLLRWLLIIGELCFLGFIYLNPDSPATTEIQSYLVNLSPYFNNYHIDPVSAVFILAFLILVLRFLIRQIQFESSTIWAIILLYLGIYHTKDMALMTYYASFSALIFIAAILETSYLLAYFDELTGLPARRALNDQLMRLGPKYTIAMVDIDFFKKFNDRYGHDIGDQVLKMVASKLKAVSGGGKSFRYGGEEFAIIFPGVTLVEAKPFLEAMREKIDSTKFTIRGLGRSLKKKNRRSKKSSKKMRPRKSVKITVSIGVAEKTARQQDAQAVIKAADQALYRAKGSGRNNVST